MKKTVNKSNNQPALPHTLEGFIPNPPSDTIQNPPGTAERVELYRRRVERNEEVFNDLDIDHFEGIERSPIRWGGVYRIAAERQKQQPESGIRTIEVPRSIGSYTED